MSLVLEEKTENFTRSTILPEHFHESLDLLVQQARELFLVEKARRMQIWLDGVTNEKNNAILKENPMQDKESITDYTSRVFGEQKFGIIFNDLHEHSLSLCRTLLGILDPIIKKHGIPSGGFDTALFVGNYGMTPLGIHKDLNGGKVITFHFGPGAKTIYQWEDDTYTKLTGYKGNYRPDSTEFLKTADRSYTFKSGDLFFMPENIWHIGLSETFSMSLTFWFNHYDQETLYRNIILKFLNKSLVKGKELLSPYKMNPGESLEVDPNIFNLQMKEGFQALKTDELFKVLYRDYQLEMLSNGGFMSPPELRKTEAVSITTTDQVIGVAPFKIYHRPEDENIILYVRGRQIELPIHEALPQVLEQLNTHKAHKVTELIKPLTNEWEEDVCLYVLTLIWANNGLETAE